MRSTMAARTLLPILAAGAAFAVYAANLGDYFLGDDFDLIGSFQDKPPGYFLRLIADNASGAAWKDWGLDASAGRGFLRPVQIWLLKLDSLLWGAQPIGFRVTSTLAFVALVLAVYFLLRTLGVRPSAAFLGAWITALHPVFSWIVPFIAAREETVVTALCLAAFVFFLRHRLHGATPLPVFACFAVALLTKETAVAWMALPVLYDLVMGNVSVTKRPALVRFYGGLLGLLVAYLALRWLAFGNVVGGDGRATSYLSFGTFFAYHARLWRGLFEPGLFADHGFRAARWLVPLACACLIGLAVARAEPGAPWPRRALFFGPCWYLATTALLYGIYFDDRHHALPVVGLAILVALAAETVAATLTRAGRVLLFASGIAGATVFLLPATLRNAREFQEASRITARARAAIEALTAGLPDGSAVLLVDTPLQEVAPFYFGWGLQSALKPPFTPSGTASRLRIIDRNDIVLNRYRTRIPRRFELEIRFAPDGSVR